MASEASTGTARPSLSVLASADYIDQLHELWQQDPSSVSEEWRLFFTGFDLAMCPRPCVAADRANDQSRVASLIFAYRSIGHLVYGTAGARVRHTIARGRILMRDFELLTLDPEAAAREAREIAPRVWERFHALGACGA